MTRVAYLGTPAMAVPPLRALVDAGIEVALVVLRAGPPARAGQRAGRRRPVKRPPSTSGCPSPTSWTTSLDAAGADLGVVVAFGRLIRPPVLERGPDGQPALLAAAALARRGPGRAGDPRRRRAHRRRPHGGRGGPRHRRHLRAGPRCRSGRTSTAAELRDRLVDVGTACWSTRSRPGSAPPEPQVGEPTYAAKLDARASCSSTGRRRPSTCTGRCASAGRGPRTRASGSRCGARRRAADRRRCRGSTAGDGAGRSSVEVQPEGKGADGRRRAWAERARAGGRPTRLGAVSATARAEVALDALVRIERDGAYANLAAARAARAAPAWTPRDRASPPSSSTAPPACGGPATSSSTAS